MQRSPPLTADRRPTGGAQERPGLTAFMEQALKQKNPTFTIQIEAAKTATHNTFSADEDVLEDVCEYRQANAKTRAACPCKRAQARVWM